MNRPCFFFIRWSLITLVCACYASWAVCIRTSLCQWTICRTWRPWWVPAWTSPVGSWNTWRRTCSSFYSLKIHIYNSRENTEHCKGSKNIPWLLSYTNFLQTWKPNSPIYLCDSILNWRLFIETKGVYKKLSVNRYFPKSTYCLTIT